MFKSKDIILYKDFFLIQSTKNKKTRKPKILSVFDFDGTLTYSDSFTLFLYFMFGKYFFIKIFNMILPITYYIFRKLTRDKLKEILIRIFLSNMDEEKLLLSAETFCKKYWTKLMRPSGILAIEKEINSGSEVIICSASPEIILRPFANKLNVNLVGTQLEINNGKLTGRITGHNCRNIYKVKRLEKIYGNLRRYYIKSWGDSYGDYELLKISQDPHWRKFHKYFSQCKPFYLLVSQIFEKLNLF